MSHDKSLFLDVSTIIKLSSSVYLGGIKENNYKHSKDKSATKKPLKSYTHKNNKRVRKSIK